MSLLARAAVSTALLLLVACKQLERVEQRVGSFNAQDKAKRRVEGILAGIQKGGSDMNVDVQTAICLWYRGKVLLDMETLSKASDLFQTWQTQGNVSHRISSYSITDAMDLGEGTVAVSGLVEGRPFRMKVPPDAPISWLQAPGAAAAPQIVATSPGADPSVAEPTSIPMPISMPTPVPTPTPDPSWQGTVRLHCTHLVPGTVVTLSIDGSEVFRKAIPASSKRAPAEIDQRISTAPGLHSMLFSMTSLDGTSVSERRIPLSISQGQLRTLKVYSQGSGVSIVLE